MIDKKQLAALTRETDLNLYQQEKDYLLKLFLYNYYRKHEDAVFKGGTCIKYLYGLPRFSEDLDFNIKNTPKEFEKQIADTLKRIKEIGIESHFIKKEIFQDAFTCEIGFRGPLYIEDKTRNKFRIDAGKRTGTIRKPTWEMIASEYPETNPNYLVYAMDEKEILSEKIMALMRRKKGRDLYDTWFLIKKGVEIDWKLMKNKSIKEGVTINTGNIPSKREYKRDMTRLTQHVIPYQQVRKEVKQALTER